MRFFERLKVATGQTLRGRVSRTAIVKGGEISVTVRFGLEELEDAKRLTPGVLIELVRLPDAPATTPARKPRIRKPRTKQLELAAGQDGPQP